MIEKIHKRWIKLKNNINHLSLLGFAWMQSKLRRVSRAHWHDKKLRFQDLEPLIYIVVTMFITPGPNFFGFAKVLMINWSWKVPHSTSVLKRRHFASGRASRVEARCHECWSRSRMHHEVFRSQSRDFECSIDMAIGLANFLWCLSYFLVRQASDSKRWSLIRMAGVDFG